MPELNFKGKQDVYAHHMTVPYRPLLLDKKRSLLKGGEGNAEDNLIIQGDNLYVLKSLMPRYEGKVKCVYIDPPYNTGKEGWMYNDRVNSPMIREWLKSCVSVDIEDMERHDKWLCMMWPRLQLLRELLAENGAIFISIDDNEVHNLRHLMDEIFGEENFVAQIAVQNNPGGRSLKKHFAYTHEYLIVYAKDIETDCISKLQKDQKALSQYKEEDERGVYKLSGLLNARQIRFFNRQTRPNLYFPIYVCRETGEVSLVQNNKFSIEVLPVLDDGTEIVWSWSQKKILENMDIVLAKKDSKNRWRIYRKDYLEGESELTLPKSLWAETEVSSGAGTKTLKEMFSFVPFNYPKPVALLERLISLSTGKASSLRSGKAVQKESYGSSIAAEKAGGDIVLDSFAGSGTTAHAVLKLNQEDGGNRRFILIECEDYADAIPAERVRRVIKGVPSAKDAKLREGLGGSFAFYTLGKPLDMESMLTGKNLPSYSVMAAWLLHTSSGLSVGAKDLKQINEDGLFYRGEQTDYYLRYRPDLEYLRGKESMLNEEMARRIGEENRQKNKKAVVFAPGKYLGQRELTKMGIAFCQLPYGIAGV